MWYPGNSVRNTHRTHLIKLCRANSYSYHRIGHFKGGKSILEHIAVKITLDKVWAGSVFPCWMPDIRPNPTRDIMMVSLKQADLDSQPYKVIIKRILTDVLGAKQVCAKYNLLTLLTYRSTYYVFKS